MPRFRVEFRDPERTPIEVAQEQFNFNPMVTSQPIMVDLDDGRTVWIQWVDVLEVWGIPDDYNGASPTAETHPEEPADPDDPETTDDDVDADADADDEQQTVPTT